MTKLSGWLRHWALFVTTDMPDENRTIVITMHI